MPLAPLPGNAAFHLGWAAILGLLAVLAFAPARGGPTRGVQPVRRPSVLLHLGLAAAVLAWAFACLLQILRDHAAGLELEALTLDPPPGELPIVSIGSGPQAGVPLPDAEVDAVHAVLHWEDSGRRALLWNASAEKRLLVDGRELHDTPLPAGTRLVWGGAESTVEALGARVPWIQRLATDLPVTRMLASHMQSTLGTLSLDAGSGAADSGSSRGSSIRLDDGPPPLPGDGPVAQVEARGGALWLGFAGPGDRASHPLLVQAPGAALARPADVRHELRDGEVLMLGRTRLRAALDAAGRVTLAVLGSGPRFAWPGSSGLVLGDDQGVLLAGSGDGRGLTLASLDAAGTRGFRRVDGRTVEAAGGAAQIAVAAGDRLEIPLAAGARGRLRLAAPGSLRALADGVASDLDLRAWRGFAVLALLYLLVSLLLPASGLLHARSSGLLHGAVLLLLLGLCCLYRLADPGEPMRVAWLLRQLRSATLAMGAASVLAAAAAVRAAFRRREPRPDALFGWLDGPRGDGARARLLYVVSVLALAAQLPFGETGIRLPGLGMLQPIELARIFLVLYLGYWTARAIDGKRERLRGLEGLRERWGYMLHAAPVVVVLALCYGLDDISPILVFSAFLAVFYAATWIRPSLRLWPPSSWGDHLLLELVLVGGVLAAIGWLVLADPDGTVARRVAVWWDPWAGGGDAWQAVTALWATAQGGLFGLGWTGQNGVLPPAVKDDFILALLAARGGSAALVLVAASFGVMLLSAAQALAAAGEDVSPGVAERRSLLAAAALWMLAIQVAVVLGSATGGLPVMGQSLPFVAAAGSQLLLFCLPALAVVLDAQRVAVPLRARPGVAAGPGLEPLSLQPIPITEGGG